MGQGYGGIPEQPPTGARMLQPRTIDIVRRHVSNSCCVAYLRWPSGPDCLSAFHSPKCGLGKEGIYQPNQASAQLRACLQCVSLHGIPRHTGRSKGNAATKELPHPIHMRRGPEGKSGDPEQITTGAGVPSVR